MQARAVFKLHTKHTRAYVEREVSEKPAVKHVYSQGVFGFVVRGKN